MSEPTSPETPDNSESQLPSGTRIRFLKTLSEGPSDERPAIIYAKAGELGEVLHHMCKEGHFVKWDKWPVGFGAVLGTEFEPIAIGIEEQPTPPAVNYTAEELKKWWPAECPKCGWKGLSRDCAGGHAIADTGDYTDPICPVCVLNELVSVVDAVDSPKEPSASDAAREGVNYDAPTPITDAFITHIDDSEIDLDQVRAKLHDFECELMHVSRLLAEQGALVARLKRYIAAADWSFGKAQTEDVTTDIDDAMKCAPSDAFAEALERAFNEGWEMRHGGPAYSAIGAWNGSQTRASLK